MTLKDMICNELGLTAPVVEHPRCTLVVELDGEDWRERPRLTPNNSTAGLRKINEEISKCGGMVVRVHRVPYRPKNAPETGIKVTEVLVGEITDALIANWRGGGQDELVED